VATGTRLGELALVGLVGVALGAFAWIARAPQPADNPPDDGMPSGAIAFFAGGSCPQGWELASGAQGRLVVGVVDGGAAGVQVGDPLADREDRQHTHDFTGSVALPGKGLLAFDGPNGDGAEAKSYTVSGTTDPATSGLPFVQMQVCVKP
jgi:hypothetical protein